MTPEAVRTVGVPAHTVAPLTLMAGAGVTTREAAAVFTQPADDVPETVYEVLVEAAMDRLGPVAPVLQVYVEAPDAVRVVVAPLHTVGLVTLITGKAFTVTCTVPVPVHPAELFPVTVYIVVVAGLTTAEPLL